jgi:predicted nucleic acid-binding protein
MDVATDTCILINLAVVDRLDLLKAVPPYIFHAPTEVLDEIEDPDQRAVVDQAIAAGHLDEVKLDQPGELGLYVSFNATLGKGESACLAVGKGRGWAIATDESKDPKWKKVISGAGFAIINTPGILLASSELHSPTLDLALEVAAASQSWEAQDNTTRSAADRGFASPTRLSGTPVAGRDAKTAESEDCRAGQEMRHLP